MHSYMEMYKHQEQVRKNVYKNSKPEILEEDGTISSGQITQLPDITAIDNIYRSSQGQRLPGTVPPGLVNSTAQHATESQPSSVETQICFCSDSDVDQLRYPGEWDNNLMDVMPYVITGTPELEGCYLVIERPDGQHIAAFGGEPAEFNDIHHVDNSTVVRVAHCPITSHYSPVINGSREDIDRDGNCFFRSVASVIQGRIASDEDTLELRISAVDRVVDIRNKFMDNTSVPMLSSEHFTQEFRKSPLYPLFSAIRRREYTNVIEINGNLSPEQLPPGVISSVWSLFSNICSSLMHFSVERMGLVPSPHSAQSGENNKFISEVIADIYDLLPTINFPPGANAAILDRKINVSAAGHEGGKGQATKRLLSMLEPSKGPITNEMAMLQVVEECICNIRDVPELKSYYRNNVTEPLIRSIFVNTGQGHAINFALRQLWEGFIPHNAHTPHINNRFLYYPSKFNLYRRKIENVISIIKNMRYIGGKDRLNGNTELYEATVKKTSDTLDMMYKQGVSTKLGLPSVENIKRLMNYNKLGKWRLRYAQFLEELADFELNEVTSVERKHDILRKIENELIKTLSMNMDNGLINLHKNTGIVFIALLSLVRMEIELISLSSRFSNAVEDEEVDFDFQCSDEVKGGDWIGSIIKDIKYVGGRYRFDGDNYFPTMKAAYERLKNINQEHQYSLLTPSESDSLNSTLIHYDKTANELYRKAFMFMPDAEVHFNNRHYGVLGDFDVEITKALVTTKYGGGFISMESPSAYLFIALLSRIREEQFRHERLVEVCESSDDAILLLISELKAIKDSSAYYPLVNIESLLIFCIDAIKKNNLLSQGFSKENIDLLISLKNNNILPIDLIGKLEWVIRDSVITMSESKYNDEPSEETTFDDHGFDYIKLKNWLAKASTDTTTKIGEGVVRRIMSDLANTSGDIMSKGKQLDDVLKNGETLSIKAGGVELELSNCLLYDGVIYFYTRGFQPEYKYVKLSVLNTHLRENNLPAAFRNLIKEGISRYDMQKKINEINNLPIWLSNRKYRNKDADEVLFNHKDNGYISFLKQEYSNEIIANEQSKGRVSGWLGTRAIRFSLQEIQQNKSIESIQEGGFWGLDSMVVSTIASQVPENKSDEEMIDTLEKLIQDTSYNSKSSSRRSIVTYSRMLRKKNVSEKFRCRLVNVISENFKKHPEHVIKELLALRFYLMKISPEHIDKLVDREITFQKYMGVIKTNWPGIDFNNFHFSSDFEGGEYPKTWPAELVVELHRFLQEKLTEDDLDNISISRYTPPGVTYWKELHLDRERDRLILSIAHDKVQRLISSIKMTDINVAIQSLMQSRSEKIKQLRKEGVYDVSTNALEQEIRLITEKISDFKSLSLLHNKMIYRLATFGMYYINIPGSLLEYAKINAVFHFNEKHPVCIMGVSPADKKTLLEEYDVLITHVETRDYIYDLAANYYYILDGAQEASITIAQPDFLSNIAKDALNSGHIPDGDFIYDKYNQALINEKYPPETIPARYKTNEDIRSEAPHLSSNYVYYKQFTDYEKGDLIPEAKAKAEMDMSAINILQTDRDNPSKNSASFSFSVSYTSFGRRGDGKYGSIISRAVSGGMMIMQAKSGSNYLMLRYSSPSVHHAIYLTKLSKDQEKKCNNIFKENNNKHLQKQCILAVINDALGMNNENKKIIEKADRNSVVIHSSQLNKNKTQSLQCEIMDFYIIRQRELNNFYREAYYAKDFWDKHLPTWGVMIKRVSNDPGYSPSSTDVSKAVQEGIIDIAYFLHGSFAAHSAAKQAAENAYRKGLKLHLSIGKLRGNVFLAYSRTLTIAMAYEVGELFIPELSILRSGMDFVSKSISARMELLKKDHDDTFKMLALSREKNNLADELPRKNTKEYSWEAWDDNMAVLNGAMQDLDLAIKGSFSDVKKFLVNWWGAPEFKKIVSIYKQGYEHRFGLVKRNKKQWEETLVAELRAEIGKIYYTYSRLKNVRDMATPSIGFNKDDLDKQIADAAQWISDESLTVGRLTPDRQLEFKNKVISLLKKYTNNPSLEFNLSSWKSIHNELTQSSNSLPQSTVKLANWRGLVPLNEHSYGSSSTGMKILEGHFDALSSYRAVNDRPWLASQYYAGITGAHAFGDGNGRLARFVYSVELLKERRFKPLKKEDANDLSGIEERTIENWGRLPEDALATWPRWNYTPSATALAATSLIKSGVNQRAPHVFVADVLQGAGLLSDAQKAYLQNIGVNRKVPNDLNVVQNIADLNDLFRLEEGKIIIFTNDGELIHTMVSLGHGRFASTSQFPLGDGQVANHLDRGNTPRIFHAEEVHYYMKQLPNGLNDVRTVNIPSKRPVTTTPMIDSEPDTRIESLLGSDAKVITTTEVFGQIEVRVHGRAFLINNMNIYDVATAMRAAIISAGGSLNNIHSIKLTSCYAAWGNEFSSAKILSDLLGVRIFASARRTSSLTINTNRVTFDPNITLPPSSARIARARFFNTWANRIQSSILSLQRGARNLIRPRRDAGPAETLLAFLFDITEVVTQKDIKTFSKKFELQLDDEKTLLSIVSKLGDMEQDDDYLFACYHVIYSCKKLEALFHKLLITEAGLGCVP
ncbi:hypothetical protein SMETH9_43170 [Serratia marcescens]|nr:hypothetical protein SMETH9_43170 [Serratia marcescens]